MKTLILFRHGKSSWRVLVRRLVPPSEAAP